MKHLKLFSTDAAYQTFKDSEDYILPNVSYIEENRYVKFNANVESAQIYNMNSFDDRKKLYEYLKSISDTLTEDVQPLSPEIIIDGYDVYYPDNNISKLPCTEVRLSNFDGCEFEISGIIKDHDFGDNQIYDFMYCICVYGPDNDYMLSILD